MINYTEALTLLMHDVVRRVPTLSFIDVADVLVFARFGRSNAEGAFFDANALERDITGAGRNIWPSERPLLLIVLTGGPATGAFYASLDDAGKATLRDTVRASLPEGPFTLPARAWLALGTVTGPRR